ncbi:MULTISPECIES: tRNA (adenosine(37)-N6)-threonylcarbamoyltransferase complex dimerization subunit type 1 TsaB [unclassified Mycoplasma]|uniref:tRNA (adenosine(37)-N6)-threonylcarbamoyltransferase complex dimerization subunit type 1 TsaB n=1 Tax=unclassified Mycoplasma TaxID=2683645 RepID=UPI00211D0F16|nr:MULTISPECIES: tRNA (adenosine(37)-N6)-threonylcarbamoyltransferase complex dimerization subunit type 1 TsaB [unclassified Mycoplasma]UUM19908.1 tRNA (adenosine(37)-N6)-threonylcarbamoyltransferase complex dimerization subunit type 1 TsaB [Mycoplasma sp. 1578d]UUM24888.1 tRNA (adenosine(37)-N6)-threonylcarbamoyltransferase complex dimerization subunit type 1 TsaB [Mycoplasma sp. 3686d]
MNVFLDTVASDLVIILFDDSFQVHDYIHIIGVKKKVELLTEQFDSLLNKHNLKYKNIEKFYINKGPGFFTGVRIALVFARTIALWTGAKIYTTNSFLILNKQITKETFVLDASGGKKYLLAQKMITNGNPNYIQNSIKVEKSDQQVDQINYQLIIDNFVIYQDIFTQEKLLDITPLYIKMPQIGEV